MATTDQRLFGKLQPELSSVPPGQIVEQAYDKRAREVIGLCKVLIARFGQEEAGDILRTARYEPSYDEGRRAAEAMGMPKDIDSYIEAHWVPKPRATIEEYLKTNKAPFWSAPGHFTYRTKTKAVHRTSNWCFVWEAFKKVADAEMIAFLAKYYCVHDAAFAKGFNPSMKFEMTKNFFRGDDFCEYTFEI